MLPDYGFAGLNQTTSTGGTGGTGSTGSTGSTPSTGGTGSTSGTSLPVLDLADLLKPALFRCDMVLSISAEQTRQPASSLTSRFATKDALADPETSPDTYWSQLGERCMKPNLSYSPD
jgi:hypothetical protein